MAKMFYSLEEVAQRLGVEEQAVRDMASEGKLQQFRDRDKLMFKREQVDALGGEAGSGLGQHRAQRHEHRGHGAQRHKRRQHGV